MATLMSWGDNYGTRGRCDNAKHPKCVCMCGGRYHGAAHRPGGVEQAVRDTWEEAIGQAKQKAKAEGMELDTSRLRKFIGEVVQGRLPLELRQAPAGNNQ